MVLESKKIEEINNDVWCRKEKNPWKDKTFIGIGVEVNEKENYEAAIFRNGKYVCEIGELSRMIDELKMVRESIIKNTGIIRV